MKNKITPPIDDHLIQFQFPDVQEFHLDNGLEVLVIERRELPKVYFRVGVKFGEAMDPPAREGAVELMARLIKKGTEKRSFAEISEAIDFMGGAIDAASGKDDFYFYGDFLSEYARDGFELLGEIMQFPTFPIQEMTKERSKLLGDLENEKSSPAFLAHRQMDQALFGRHPYARYKTAESLLHLTRETLLELHQSYFRPDITYLVFAGDIDAATARAWAEEVMGEWSGAAQPTGIAAPEAPGQPGIYLVHRPNSQQCNLLFGNMLFPAVHPDYEKALVANKILGGGASGRLFLTLREEKGYTYGAYSSLDTFHRTGAWIASAEVSPEVLGDAIDCFYEQFKTFRETLPDEEELRNAKRYLMGVFPLKNETPAAIASLTLTSKLDGRNPDYWNEHLQKIDRVQAEDVRQIAQRYLIPDHQQLVVVGDAEQVGNDLSRFGKVTVVDLDGKQL